MHDEADAIRDAVGNAAHAHPEQAGRSHAPEPQSPVSASQALKDPVCGMTVTEQSPHRFDHEGSRYYFCSAGCKTKF